MSLTAKVSKSIVYNVIGTFVVIVANFALLPFLMTKVDKGLYGVSIIVLTCSGWLSSLDMGVGAAVMKYVSEYLARKDYKTLTKIFNTSLSFYMVVGLSIGVILFSFSFFYDKIFNVAPEHLVHGKYLFYIASVASVFSWSLIPFRQAVMGLNRFDVINKINVLFHVGNLLLAHVVFLFTDFFPLYVAISQTFFVLCQVFYVYFLRNNLKAVKIKLLYFDKATFFFIMKFSSYLFVGLLCNILIFQTDNILTGIYVSAAVVTVYYAATRVADAIRTVNGLLGSPFIVAFSELQGRGEYEKQEKYLFKCTRIETALMIPIVLITFVFARELIVNWLGEDFVLAALILRVLLVWWFFNSVLLMVQVVILGKGQTDVFLYPNIINAISNLVLSLILVRFLGVVGIALGTTIPMVITTTFLIRLILKRLKIPVVHFLKRSVLPNLLYYLVVVLLAVLADRYINVDNIFLTVFVMGMVYSICCLFYYQFFLGQEDKVLVRKLLRIAPARS